MKHYTFSDIGNGSWDVDVLRQVIILDIIPVVGGTNIDKLYVF